MVIAEKTCPSHKGTNHSLHHTNHNNQVSYCTTFLRWFCLHEACSMSEGAETTGSAPVQTVTSSCARTLTELRLRVEARYIDAGVLNAFAATPENPMPKAMLAAVAKWLRDRLPTGMMLHDLRVFPMKPATRGWMGRVSVRSDLADRLLFSSGEMGVFVTLKDRTGQICWLPDNASLEAASKHATKNNGRLVANARRLNVCVPDARIRKTTLAILGAEATSLKGCPVLVVEVLAGMDPRRTSARSSTTSA